MIEITWDEAITSEYKRFIVYNNHFAIDIIVHYLGYNDYLFFYDKYDLTKKELKKLEEIENYLTNYCNKNWTRI